MVGGAYTYAVTSDFIVDPTQKLRIDGNSAGNTYIYEAAADRIDLIAGGSAGLIVTSTFVAVQPTAKFYLDGAVDTYIDEISANVLNFNVGGTSALQLATAWVEVRAGHDLVLPSAKKFYLDGGSDTYINEAASNQIDFTVGGTLRFRIKDQALAYSYAVASDFIIDPAKKFYLDGAGDTYIIENSANSIQIVTGGATAATFTSAGIAANLNGNVTGNVTGSAGTAGSATTAGTVTGAAQTAITSVGTLTALTISGDLTMTAAASRLIPGATSFTHRNNANSADNLSITDAGFVTIRNGLTLTAGNVRATEHHDAADLRLLGARKTGWGVPTGTQTRTTFDTASVNLAILAEHVKALIDDLTNHGMIGA